MYRVETPDCQYSQEIDSPRGYKIYWQDLTDAEIEEVRRDMKLDERKPRPKRFRKFPGADDKGDCQKQNESSGGKASSTGSSDLSRDSPVKAARRSMTMPSEPAVGVTDEEINEINELYERCKRNDRFGQGDGRLNGRVNLVQRANTSPFPNSYDMIQSIVYAERELEIELMQDLKAKFDSSGDGPQNASAGIRCSNNPGKPETSCPSSYRFDRDPFDNQSQQNSTVTTAKLQTRVVHTLARPENELGGGVTASKPSPTAGIRKDKSELDDVDDDMLVFCEEMATNRLDGKNSASSKMSTVTRAWVPKPVLSVDKKATASPVLSAEVRAQIEQKRQVALAKLKRSRTDAFQSAESTKTEPVRNPSETIKETVERKRRKALELRKQKEEQELRTHKFSKRFNSLQWNY